MVGLSSGTCSLARQCSDSSTGRKPQSASKVVSASSSSGLWNGSLNVRVGVVPRARRRPPRRRSRPGPARSSGAPAATAAARRRAPSSGRAAGCRTARGRRHRAARSGCSSIALSSGVPSDSTLGASGWAPIHSSAYGRSAGLASPRSSGITVRLTPGVVAHGVHQGPHRLGGYPRNRAFPGMPMPPAREVTPRRLRRAARTSGAPSRAASAVWSSGMRCDSRSAATRAV